eukprot:NODE_5010_length_620_cov_197.847788.p2 GENE.NODE_5010_length_620_cov_197.847788~~NODE_5010_length_620_cov_197.847788.p2  ORF type:complete len:131 (-),score=42.79 NODE_5010_length_620_cov_197.847788:210-602(-)
MGGRGDVSTDAEIIDETRFHATADPLLDDLFDVIDEADFEFIEDIHCDDGVLTLELEDGRAFVINKHYATRQIWYASPVSGALYFSLQPNGTWVSQGRELTEVLKADLVSMSPDLKNLDLSGCGGLELEE